MFRWEKLGLVFSPHEHKNSWLDSFAQAPSVIVFEDCIRVYFSCRPEPEPNGNFRSFSAYVELEKNDSFNVLRLADEPVLQLGDRGHFDEFGTYPFSVIKHKNEFIAYYGGWTRCVSVPFNVSIGMATSLDGKTFRKVGNGPVVSFSAFEPFVLSGPKIRRYNGMFFLWYIAGRKWKLVEGKPEPVYKIRMATSDDGYSWRKLDKDIIESRVEEDEAQASPDVFYSNGKYHMFFSYRYSANYRSKKFGYRIGYAYSENLVDWKRDDSKVGIDISDSGWDSEMISYPNLFSMNNCIYMAYLGNGVGRDGFGMAKLVGEL